MTEEKIKRTGKNTVPNFPWVVVTIYANCRTLEKAIFQGNFSNPQQYIFERCSSIITFNYKAVQRLLVITCTQQSNLIPPIHDGGVCGQDGVQTIRQRAWPSHIEPKTKMSRRGWKSAGYHDLRWSARLSCFFGCCCSFDRFQGWEKEGVSYSCLPVFWNGPSRFWSRLSPSGNHDKRWPHPLETSCVRMLRDLDDTSFDSLRYSPIPGF